jgi:hypothetical protein
MRILRKLSAVTALFIFLSLLDGCGQGGGADNVAPALVVNAGSMVGEGSTHVIVATELFYRDSAQPPTSVRFTVTVPPREGQLEATTQPKQQINEFTQADIDTGRLVYRHVRGKVAADGFEFSVTDGQGNTLSAQHFRIDVVPDIRSLELTRGLSTVVLSWIAPSSANLAGMEIRRSVDGHYPASPTDGVLISRVQVSTHQVTDNVSYDPANGITSFYYTVFSYSADGIYSGGARVGLYCDPSRCVTVPDLRDLNRLYSQQNVESLRNLDGRLCRSAAIGCK